MPFLKQSAQSGAVNLFEFENKLTLGRSRENNVVIDDPTVSQQHAEILLQDEHWLLVDTGSTNGVLIDGNRQSQVELADGLVFVIGTQSFEFCLVDPGQLDKTLQIKKSWIPGVYYTE